MDWHRLKPRYWMQNYPTDLVWDAALNRALDQNKVEVTGYRARVGNIRVWISNWPYAYGQPVIQGDCFPALPTVATRKRLRARILSDALETATPPVDMGEK